MTHNITTGVDDFIVTRRNPLIRELEIKNFSGSYFTYSVDNIVPSSLRNRLRVINIGEPQQGVSVETYTFYRTFVNITAGLLSGDDESFSCYINFQSSKGKEESMHVIVLKKGRTNVVQREGIRLNGKYLDLSVTK